jgi:hypothetical protein
MRGLYNSEQITEMSAPRVGIPADELLAELQYSCEHMGVDPALFEVVSELRAAGVAVILATDNMDTFSRWTVPALELERHFDSILNSFHIGALKADRDVSGRSPFFSPCLDSGCYSPPFLLIDDSQQVLNAVNLGIEVITTQGPEQTLGLLRHLAAGSAIPVPC